MKKLRRYCALVFILTIGIEAARAGAKPWITFENCQLLPNAANDGDSFHVRAGGRHYIFRLYFVDTPETEATFPDRVAEQAKYFHVSVAQALQIGHEAERFTAAKLSRPFTVVTRKQDARGQSHLARYFAFVAVDREDLGEELVANGLARIHGSKADDPASRPSDSEERQLTRLEIKARTEKLGGWGVSAGRLGTRAGAPSRGSQQPDGNSFDDFFHPAPEAVSPGSMPSAAEALDINQASKEALENLPGVGPVLAARIISGRPFASGDELRRVPGIGDKKYALLRPYFR